MNISPGSLPAIRRNYLFNQLLPFPQARQARERPPTRLTLPTWRCDSEPPRGRDQSAFSPIVRRRRFSHLNYFCQITAAPRTNQLAFARAFQYSWVSQSRASIHLIAGEWYGQRKM
jgi:hypothetical protein